MATAVAAMMRPAEAGTSALVVSRICGAVNRLESGRSTWMKPSTVRMTSASISMPRKMPVTKALSLMRNAATTPARMMVATPTHCALRLGMSTPR